jgi:hypothetical protein
MKRFTLLFASILILAGLAVGQSCPLQPHGPARFSRVGGIYYAAQYACWQGKIATGGGSATTGSNVYTLVSGTIVTSDGRRIVPYSITAPLLIGSGANQETVTPSAVSGCALNAPLNSCKITVSTSNAHGDGDIIQSGTVGLQEAIEDASGDGGGTVVTDQYWVSLGGTSALITTTAIAKTNVFVYDLRTTPAFYGKSSTSYVQAFKVSATSLQFPQPIQLGVAGSAVGEVDFFNATSGSIALKPVTGALGTVVATLPANTGTISETNLAETFSAVKTFTAAPVFPTAGVGFVNATSGSITVAAPTGALGTVTNTLPAMSGGIVAGFSCGSTGVGSQTCSPSAVNGQMHLYNGESTLSSNAATITFPVAFASTTSFSAWPTT